MRPGLSARVAAAAAAVLLLLAAPVRAQENPAAEIAASQKRLEQIRRERTSLRDELAKLRTQVRDLSGELRNIERQVATSADLVRELELQVTTTEQQIEQITHELNVTHAQLLDRKQTLNRRLRDIYKRGPLHTPQVLLTANSFSELLNRYKYLYLIARRDRALVQEVTTLEHRLALRERQLRQSLLELQNLQQERSEEYAAIASLQTERQRTLATFQTRERRTNQRYQQLEKDEKQLRALIATLERKRKEAERLAAERRKREAEAAAAARRAGAPAPAKTATAAPRTGLSTRDLGRLGWPVEGTLVYRFGRVRQPNGGLVRMNGIGIAAPSGTPVRSVDAGTVVLAAPFEGYGPTVVLSHGGGYYSLYLYLKDIAVKEGAEVARNQVLGSVGGGGTAEGAHIEFQIRAPGGQAVDPLSWLRERAAR